MNKNVKQSMQVMWVLKSLLACYLVTGLLLLGVAFLLYKFDLSEQMVTIGIVATYAVSSFAGGFIAGKVKQEKRFLWGLAMGAIYYVLLLLISMGVYRELSQGSMQLLSAALLCLGGGMLGGMLS